MKSTIFWIPVEEELPEYETEVLVCDDLDGVTLGVYSEIAGWQLQGESLVVKWWAAKPLPPSRTGTTRLDHKQLVGWVD